MSDDDVSDNELGLFLRTRREAVTPADVGLPTGPRRRTPGLRRSELATLAQVSAEYLTRLEQGRDRHPSGEVIAALADALRLGSAERVHLHRLVKVSGGGHCGVTRPARTVRPTVRALLQGLEPTAAVLLNHLGEALAWTDGYERLARPLGLLDGDPPNLTRFVLADERARAVYPDWGKAADEQVAALKAGPFRAGPDGARLVDELLVTAGREFRDRLASVASLTPSAGVQRVVHPDAGELRLAYETLELPADDGLRIQVHLGADPASEAALEGLRTSVGGGLRVVSG